MRSWLVFLVVFTTAITVSSLGVAKSNNRNVIAFVELNQALNEVAEGKSAKKKLKAEFEKRQKKLDAMQNELKTEQNEFVKRSSLMQAEIRAAKQQQLQRKMAEFQQTYTQLQQQIMGQEAKMTQEIGEKLTRVIKTIGDRDGYNMILNIAGNVLYHKEHRNITDQVIKEYNQRFGTGAK